LPPTVPDRDREGEAQKVEDARKITSNVDWNCEVKTLFRDENLGCKYAVSGAITCLEIVWSLLYKGLSVNNQIFRLLGENWNFTSVRVVEPTSSIGVALIHLCPLTCP